MATALMSVVVDYDATSVDGDKPPSSLISSSCRLDPGISRLHDGNKLEHLHHHGQRLVDTRGDVTKPVTMQYGVVRGYPATIGKVLTRDTTSGGVKSSGFIDIHYLKAIIVSTQ